MPTIYWKVDFSGINNGMKCLHQASLPASEAIKQIKENLQDLGGNELKTLPGTAAQVSAGLGVVGEKAQTSANAVIVMASAVDEAQRKSLESLEGYTIQFGTATAKTKGLGDSLVAGFYGVDQTLGNCFQNMLNGAEVSFDGIRKSFASMLADMANMTLLRPITVSVFEKLGNLLELDGTVTLRDKDGEPVDRNNLPFLPDFLTSGVNDLLGTILPGSSYTSLASIGTTSGSLSTSALQGAVNLPVPGTYTGGLVGGLSLGSALTYGGLGGLGYSMFGGALGLPQNKYSSLTASAGGALGAWGGSALGAAMGSSGAISGAMAGSMAFPVVGTILGALGGGLLSSVFGGKKPKRPAVWGGAELNLGSDLAGYDFTSAFDSKGYGKDSFSVIEAEQYAIAARSRNKAGGEFSDAFSKMLSEVSKLGLQQAEDMQEALPDAYAAAFKTQLAANPISAEWDFKGEDISEESFKQAAEELQQKVNASMLSAFQGMDFSEYAGKITVDQSAIEGLNKFSSAIKLTEEAMAATEAVGKPTSQFVEQAKAANKQMEEWSKSMQAVGVTTEYATSLMDAYRQANIGAAMKDIADAVKAITEPTSQLVLQAQAAKKQMDDWTAGMKEYGANMDEVNAAVNEYHRAVIKANIDALQASLTPLSQYEQAIKAANQSVDDHKAALAELGATEEEIARVEGLRSQVLESMIGPMKLAFDQDLQLRQVQLSGDENKIAAMQLAIKHERELADVRSKFGGSSLQMAQMQLLHDAEKQQLEWMQKQAGELKTLQDQAKAAQVALTAATRAESEANSALSKAQTTLNAARNAYLSALNKEAASLKSTMDAISRAVEQLGRTRRDLLTNADSSPLGTAQRYVLAGAELERTFAKAMTGDAEAMAELSRLSEQYLDVSKEANADFSKYRKDFEKVQNMLAAAEAAGGAQMDAAQKQLDLLNAQIAAATEGTAQIVGSIKELEVAFVAALGDYNAAQEAARKAQQAAEEARRKAEEAANKAQQDSQQTAPKSWMQDVLERKTAAMNRGETLGPGQVAGGWTPETVLQEMIKLTGSFGDWYRMYGKLEGFAKGGLASGWALVGEEGPELVNFSQPGRVYTAEDTAEMLSSTPRLSVSSFDSNAELIAEIRALRREVAELRAEQGRSQFRIIEATQRTARKLDQFDFDGLPHTRAQ